MEAERPALVVATASKPSFSQFSNLANIPDVRNDKELIVHRFEALTRRFQISHHVPPTFVSVSASCARPGVSRAIESITRRRSRDRRQSILGGGARPSILTTPSMSKSCISNLESSRRRAWFTSSTSVASEHRSLARTCAHSSSSVRNLNSLEFSRSWRAYLIRLILHGASMPGGYRIHNRVPFAEGFQSWISRAR